MTTTLDERVVRARKDHRCCTCGGTITKGTLHPVQKNVDNDDIWTWRSHETCDRIARAIIRDAGYLADEWPGEWDVQDAMRLIVSVLTRTAYNDSGER